ncbi:MAG: hypothetical protein L6Q78_10640 [Bacteroidia bacterium]|nr:hypothetical protein [Bacteroidia bacterium]
MFYFDISQHTCLKKKLSALFLFLFGVLSINGYAQVAGKNTPLEIVFASEAEVVNQKDNQYTKLLGSVKMKQDKTILECDSAFFYDKENRVEAFSNVRINHNDSVWITGQHLIYNGNSKLAELDGNVKLWDNSMSLTTSQLDYDMNLQYGYYNQGGEIISTSGTLTSKYGYYYARTRDFYFKKEVAFVNPEYTMTSDTLLYNTGSKKVSFFGSADIKSAKDRILCDRGWYDTKTDITQLSGKPVLFSDRRMLEADSLFYNRKTKFGRGIKNFHLFDSAQKLHVYGSFAQTNGLKGYTYVTGTPYVFRSDGKDSLYIFADTIAVFQKQKLQKEYIQAYRRVKIFQKEIQVVTDSLVYLADDSCISLFYSPIMWNGENQISSDTIRFYLKNNSIDSFRLLSDAFLVSKEKGIHFNQIKGRMMAGKLDSSRIRDLFVSGNCQSIHYEKEDSVHYIGINVIDCGEMNFRFESGKLNSAAFFNNPDATLYPPDELKPEDLKLKGFRWLPQLRPQKPDKDILKKK